MLSIHIFILLQHNLLHIYVSYNSNQKCGGFCHMYPLVCAAATAGAIVAAIVAVMLWGPFVPPAQ